MPDPMPPPVLNGPYRVEFRHAGSTIDLGTIERSFAHHSELVPYMVHLYLCGHTSGAVVLVLESSGEVVAQRELARPLRRMRRSLPLRSVAACQQRTDRGSEERRETSRIVRQATPDSVAR